MSYLNEFILTDTLFFGSINIENSFKLILCEILNDTKIGLQPCSVLFQNAFLTTINFIFFVWDFSSHSRNFHSYENVIITGEGLYSVLMTIEQ